MFEVVKQTYQEARETILHNDANTCILGIAGVSGAGLLKEKYENLVGKNNEDVRNVLWISSRSSVKKYPYKRLEEKNRTTFETFEEVMYKTIKKYIHYIGWTDDIRPIGKKDIRDILNAVSEKGTLPTAKIQDLLNQISTYKNKITNPEDYIKMLQKGVEWPHTESEKHSFFRRYVNMQIQFKILDADDIKHLSTALISKFYKEDPLPYKYILVDDFQNMSHLHFDFLKALSVTNASIYAAGDFDRQSLKAEFSKNELLCAFSDAFNCKIWQLDASETSCNNAWNKSYGYPNILEDAKSNDVAFGKSQHNRVDKIYAVFFNTLTAHICDEIEVLKEEKDEDCCLCVDDDEIAVFYRQKETANIIKTELNKRWRQKITEEYDEYWCNSYSSPEECLKHMGNDYLDLSAEDYSENDTMRYYIALIGTLVRNNPYDYYYVITHRTNVNLSKYFWANTHLVPEVNYDDFQTNFRISNLHSFGIDPDSHESIVLCFLSVIKMGELQRKIFSLKRSIQLGNLKSALKEMKSFFGLTEKNKKMIEVFESIEHSSNFNATRLKQSDTDALLQAIDAMIVSTSIDCDYCRCRFVNYEDAAGLTFKYVFLTDLIDGVLPSADALEEGNDSAERRLMYTAATTASESIYLCYYCYVKGKNGIEWMGRSKYLNGL